jgi:hypothetical protein
MASAMGQRMLLRGTALALFSFLIVAHGVSAFALWLSVADRDAISTSLQRALNERDNTVLFIGTSRIKYGLDPVRFDEAMKAKGISTKSYMFGVPALSFVEMEYLLTSYFEKRPCCVKYVFVEPDLGSDGTLRSPNSIRSILFFDFPNAINAFTYALEQQEAAPQQLKAPFSLETKLTFFKQILGPLFRHYTNAGLFQALTDDNQINFRTEPNLGEYIEQGKPQARLSDIIESDTAKRQQYYEALKELSEPYSPSHVSDMQFARFMRLMNYIESKGAEPIVLRPAQFIFAPISASVVARIRAACSDTFPVLDFGRPADNEELFEPRNRYDYDHIHLLTIERFTLMVADRFAATLNTNRAAPACLNEAAR